MALASTTPPLAGMTTGAGCVPDGDVEILVHVAAPSRIADDATYRRLARAYLAFRPGGREWIARVRMGGGGGGGGEDGLEEEHHDGHGDEQDGEHNDEQHSFVRDSGMGAAAERAFVFESQDLSFQSALDNRSSPRLGMADRLSAWGEGGELSLEEEEGEGEGEGDGEAEAEAEVEAVNPHNLLPWSSLPPSSSFPSSWKTPPSEVGDSYPLPGAAMLNVTPTRVLQRYLEHQGAGASASPGPSSSVGGVPDEKDPWSVSSYGFEAVDVPSSIPIPASVQGPRHAWRPRIDDDDDDDVIPVTPAPPPVGGRGGGGSSRKRPAPEKQRDEGVEQEHQHQHQQDMDIALDTTHISSSSLSGASSISISLPAAAVEATGPEESESPPPSKMAKRIHDDDDDTRHIRSNTTPSLSILPPPPPPSISPLSPSALISPKLDKLSHDLSSRYNPLPHRPLGPFERGHWLIDCRAWSPTTRLDTWLFLTNYLRSGLAGWGVWCCRDEAHQRISLYCWGHVAKHMYLLLYLASGREVKYTGAQWRDGAGEVVIEVVGTGR
ncbi:hypothetical protein E4U55_002778 [Claviceps digitariae]|nr:hypothetical protein E4U55_002778 [Claviceps digitariae]